MFKGGAESCWWIHPNILPDISAENRVRRTRFYDIIRPALLVVSGEHVPDQLRQLLPYLPLSPSLFWTFEIQAVRVPWPSYRMSGVALVGSTILHFYWRGDYYDQGYGFERGDLHLTIVYDDQTVAHRVIENIRFNMW
jgi:hypothetical protein